LNRCESRRPKQLHTIFTKRGEKSEER